VTGDRLAQGRSPRPPRSCQALPRARCSARECRASFPRSPGVGVGTRSARARRDRAGDGRPRATAPRPWGAVLPGAVSFPPSRCGERAPAEVRIRRRVGRPSRQERSRRT
jgi:hypothetical protein